MLVIGVDPGLTGALSLLGGDCNLLECTDIPVCSNGQSTGSMKRWVDEVALRALLAEWSVRHDFAREHVSAVMERPIAMPTLPAQTIASQFDSFGTIRGVLSMLRRAGGDDGQTHVVEPRQWKKRYGIRNDKDHARQVAGALYPDAPVKRVKDHNRAEAILIAHYWLKEHA
jgi:crossover junction endodeoxyribonuclease RuvC